MEIGLRLLAFLLDTVLCVCSCFVVFLGTGWLSEHTGSFGLLFFLLMFVLFATMPFIYFCVPTGIWGRTPGKWICRLKVIDHRDESPGFWRGVGREALKLLALGSGIGATICLFQALYVGVTWYDQMCGTQVSFTPWVRLTKTQRHFRKHYKP